MLTIRSFTVRHGQIVSPFTKIPLTLVENATPAAICLANLPPGEKQIYTSKVDMTIITKHNFVNAPHPNCTCGYYSKDIKSLKWSTILLSTGYYQTSRQFMHLLFVVQPWGTIIEHQKGVRSQYITLIATIIPNQSSMTVKLFPHFTMEHYAQFAIPAIAHLGLPNIATQKQLYDFVISYQESTP